MMEAGKDRTSLKGSKSNVAESNLPLLENPTSGDSRGSPEKERIDIESTIEKDDEGREKDSQQDIHECERRPRIFTCMEQFTVHMNLLNRDSQHINSHVNVAFEDVLAEPSSNQGFDQTWSLAFMLFSATKYWVYRVLAAACAVPCGLVWGLIFSLLSLLSVWLITPIMKVIDVCLYIIQRVWTGVIHAILDPVFRSVSLMFGKTHKTEATLQELP